MYSVNIHSDFFKIIRRHKKEEIADLFLALAADIDGGERPTLPVALDVIRELIVDQNERFSKQQSEKRKNKKATQSAQNENCEKPTQPKNQRNQSNQSNQTNQRNQRTNATSNTNTKTETNTETNTNTETEDITGATENGGTTRARARTHTQFEPPSANDVAEYCKERNNGINAEHFCDYYTTRGWVLGKGQRMRDWRAAVRTWERTSGVYSRAPPTAQTGLHGNIKRAIDGDKDGDSL